MKQTPSLSPLLPALDDESRRSGGKRVRGNGSGAGAGGVRFATRRCQGGPISKKALPIRFNSMCCVQCNLVCLFLSLFQGNEAMRACVSGQCWMLDSIVWRTGRGTDRGQRRWRREALAGAATFVRRPHQSSLCGWFRYWRCDAQMSAPTHTCFMPFDACRFSLVLSEALIHMPVCLDSGFRRRVSRQTRKMYSDFASYARYWLWYSGAVSYCLRGY